VLLIPGGVGTYAYLSGRLTHTIYVQKTATFAPVTNTQTRIRRRIIYVPQVITSTVYPQPVTRTVTVPGPRVTVPGPVVTVPGPTVTVTVSVPGGGTTAVPPSFPVTP
jgi:hypothetical protein